MDTTKYEGLFNDLYPGNWSDITGYKVLKKKPERGRYLRRRTGHQAEPCPTLEPAVKAAVKSLAETFPQGLKISPLPHLAEEAAASSAIEDEYHTEDVKRHQEALRRFLQAGLSRTSLLEAHRRIMEGQKRAQPGRLRAVNVYVGSYNAPEHKRVPDLLNAMLLYARKTPDPAPVAAAWGHAQFESVHPFADGNGRTGRAIIQQMLGAPLPLSVWILERRAAYYAMLENADWERYLEWFLQGIETTCARIKSGEFPEYAAGVLTRAAANRTMRTHSE